MTGAKSNIDFKAFDGAFDEYGIRQSRLFLASASSSLHFMDIWVGYLF